MVEEKYNTFWPRFCAFIIDGIVFIPVYELSKFIWSHHSGYSTVTLALWHVLFSLSFLAYSILLHGKYGQTVGKMATGVKVVDYSETPLRMSQAVRRDIVPLIIVLVSLAVQVPQILKGVNLFNPTRLFDSTDMIFVSVQTGWIIAELLTMLTNSNRRAIHDFIAGSVVLKTKI